MTIQFTELPSDAQAVVQKWATQCLSALHGCDYRLRHYITGEENAFKTIGDLDLAMAFIVRTRKEVIAAHGLKDFGDPNMEI